MKSWNPEKWKKLRKYKKSLSKEESVIRNLDSNSMPLRKEENKDRLWLKFIVLRKLSDNLNKNIRK